MKTISPQYNISGLQQSCQQSHLTLKDDHEVQEAQKGGHITAATKGEASSAMLT